MVNRERCRPGKGQGVRDLRESKEWEVGRKPNRLTKPRTAIAIAIVITTGIVNNCNIVQHKLVIQNSFPIGLSTDRGALHGMGRYKRKWDEVKEK